ncbi:hypothetical protein, partial [Streptomyces sp. NRRL S-920]|uniref:hypothetical protein n=1 Tax=Streptomyces sp. NRRL S-920 TaxID=1463921 RepID=UPI001F200C1E
DPEGETASAPHAVDHPGRDAALTLAQRVAAVQAHQQAEREAQRPVCTRCGTKFTDERWQLIMQTSWRSAGDDLCGPCRQQDIDRAQAERVARREAEESAAREAAEAEAKKSRGLFRRRR